MHAMPWRRALHRQAIASTGSVVQSLRLASARPPSSSTAATSSQPTLAVRHQSTSIDIPSAFDDVEPISVPDATSGDAGTAVAGGTERAGGAGAFSVLDDAPSLDTHPGLAHTLDLLIDDLLNCRTEVLKGFARMKNCHQSSKSGIVMELISNAKDDDAKKNELTKQIMGIQNLEDMEKAGFSMKRNSWDDTRLEMSVIQSAAKKQSQFNLVDMVALYKSIAQPSCSLSRHILHHFVNDWGTVTAAAVDMSPNISKDAAERVLKSCNTDHLIAAFSAATLAFLHRQESGKLFDGAKGKAVCSDQLQLFGMPPTPPQLLRQILDVLPGVVAMQQQVQERGVGVSRFQHGSMTHDRLSILLQTVGSRGGGSSSTGNVIPGSALASATSSAVMASMGGQQEAPAWLREFVQQYDAWEQLVRSELPSHFGNVTSWFFDLLLVCVAAMHANGQLVPWAACESVDFSAAYRRIVLDRLLQECGGTPSASLAALNALQRFVNESPRSTVRVAFLQSIYQQVASMSPNKHVQPSENRIHLVRLEYALASERLKGGGSLLSLLWNVADEVHFTMRFYQVNSKLATSERLRLVAPLSAVGANTGRSGSQLAADLLHYEAKYGMVAPPFESVAFICAIFMYMAATDRSLSGAPGVLTGSNEQGHMSSGEFDRELQICTSYCQNPFLSHVYLARMKSTTVNSLNVKLPPRLTAPSWLSDRLTDPESSSGPNNGGVYKFVDAAAVKGVMAPLMLISRAPIILALDYISSLPWKVNKFILYVIEAVIQEGFLVGKVRQGFFPLSYARLKMGTEQAHPLSTPDLPVENMNLRRVYQDRLAADWRELSDIRGSRIHMLQALRQARAVLNAPAVYFPNNMDFRGRFYPIPGRLSHVGSDPFRSLLCHADRKPLGADGLRWLKVHVANKMGKSKLSYTERVLWVDEHITDVVASAESPLSGHKWWQDADDPFGALAACKELCDAMNHSQGPEAFESNLLVAVDGSYNGLQHYSAIGRDENGGKLVNLVPRERPADAYSSILNVALDIIRTDAKENDHEIAQRCLGSGIGLDKNHIRRKTIKQPIMTQVYGVTAFGMTEQIKIQLMEQNKAHGLWTPVVMGDMSRYLTQVLNTSLGATFKETTKCRQWLEDISTLVFTCQPKELRNALMWTTPLGLVVRQPYRNSPKTMMFTRSGAIRIPASTISAASTKQLSAFAPNFIHSLDATHLAMTALEMKRLNLHMAAVHDSFWTHACDMPVLSRVLREQFVDLYENYDPLTELKQQWEELFFADLRRCGVRLPDPPKRGTLDLKVVLESEYFFS